MSEQQIDLRTLLSMPTDQVERPRPLPEGDYIARITNYSFGQSKNKGTHFIRFDLALEEAAPSVEPEKLVGITIAGRAQRVDYFLTPNAIFRLTDALDGVLGQQSGRTFDERLPEMRDQRVMIHVTQRESQDGKETYNDVKSMVAAP